MGKYACGEALAGSPCRKTGPERCITRVTGRPRTQLQAFSALTSGRDHGDDDGGGGAAALNQHGDQAAHHQPHHRVGE